MIGALLAIIVNTSLINGSVTAGQLLASCAGDAPIDEETCKAFIVSGANTLSAPDTGLRQICPPTTAKFNTFLAAYLSYIERHPDESDRPAVIVTLEAYEGAFPCRQP